MILGWLEREKGLEPSTICMASRCSTTELLPLGLPPNYRGSAYGMIDGRRRSVKLAGRG